jgi:hypothetical protein
MYAVFPGSDPSTSQLLNVHRVKDIGKWKCMQLSH